jgi:hypothetical protein
MQDPRYGGLPDPGSVAYCAQKVVLLELVVSPPHAGDRIDDLIARLPVPDHAVVPAIVALEAAGLAEHRSAVARASAAAVHFEHLWPVMLSTVRGP